MKSLIKLSLLLVLGLSAIGCSGKSASSSASSGDSSSSASSSGALSSSSNAPVALPAIQIKDVYNDSEFTLEELPDVTFRIGPKVLNDDGSLYVHPLYANDVRITEDTIDRLLFAYDINKDGYRD